MSHTRSRRWGRVPYDPESRARWRHLPFPEGEYRRRLRHVLATAAEAGYDAVLVRGAGMDAANVRYLSGFPNPYMGEVALLLPMHGRPVLVTDSVAHGEPMHSEIYQTWFEDVRCAPNARAAFAYEDAGSLRQHVVDGLQELGLAEASIATVGGQGHELLDHLRATLPSLRLEGFDARMARLRAVKSDAELAVLRQAADIADAALQTAVEAVRPGASERDVARALLGEMMLRGADGPMHGLQVVSGPRSGFRNLPPSDRTILDGDATYVGFGLWRDGYCARAATGFPAGAASPEYHALLEANAEIVETAVAAAGPGMPAADLARLVEATAAGLGVEDWYWGAGHGVGAHTHDPPVIAPGSTDVLEPGMTFVFEPMLCRTGLGTANAERVYQVTVDGVQCLSRLPLRLWLG